MDPDAVYETLMEVDLGGGRDKAGDFERRARELGPDEYGRATFLSTAAEHRQMDGDLDAALEMCLISRHSLRRELDLGRDELDRVAEDVIDELEAPGRP